MRGKGACAALVATAALIGAGCGGDDEEEALSKREFVKQGNAICERFSDRIEEFAEENFADVESEADLTPEIADEFIDAALPEFETALDDLDELGAPEGDEDAVDEFVEAGRSEAEEIADASGDESVDVITRDSATPEFDRLTSAYGLDSCDDA